MQRAAQKVAHVEPSGRRRGEKRVGGAVVGDRMMLAGAAGVRVAALRVDVYGTRGMRSHPSTLFVICSYELYRPPAR